MCLLTLSEATPTAWCFCQHLVVGHSCVAPVILSASSCAHVAYSFEPSGFNGNWFQFAFDSIRNAAQDPCDFGFGHLWQYLGLDAWDIA